MRVAVIDDSKTSIMVTQDLLNRLGHEVVIFDKGLGVQAFVMDTQPDLVLLDVEMPGLDGPSLCTMLRKRAKTAHTLVALYSTLPVERLSSLVASCGADGFLEKTSDIEAFSQRLRLFLLGAKRTDLGGSTDS